MHPLHPPKTYIHLLGGLSPINLMHWHEALCLVWGVREPFPLAMAMVRHSACVFCVCRSTYHYFPVGPGHIGYCRKALPRARRFSHCTEVKTYRLKRKGNKWVTTIYSLRRDALYLRKKCVVHMPRCCLYPDFYCVVNSSILTTQLPKEQLLCPPASHPSSIGGKQYLDYL